MALWPSEEPSDPNALRARREYWIEGAPTPRKHGRAQRRWAVGVVGLLGLGAGAVYYWPFYPTRVAGPAAVVAASKGCAPEDLPAPNLAPSRPPTPNLVIGLHPIGEPLEQRAVDHAPAPYSAPEPHYAVGLRPITQQVSPPPDPVVVALPSDAPPVTPPAPVKSSRKQALPAPPTHPTSGQVRF